MVSNAIKICISCQTYKSANIQINGYGKRHSGTVILFLTVKYIQHQSSPDAKRSMLEIYQFQKT